MGKRFLIWYLEEEDFDWSELGREGYFKKGMIFRYWGIKIYL